MSSDDTFQRKDRDRASEAWAAAEEEATALRECVRIHEHEGVSWDEAKELAGVVMPHTTFRRKLARLEKYGIEGLLDHRHPPPPKLTPKIRGGIEVLGALEPLLPTAEIRATVMEQFDVEVSPRSVQQILKDAGLARPVVKLPAKKASDAAVPEEEKAPDAEDAEPVREELGGAGLALLRVASELTGYGSQMAGVVAETARNLPQPAEPTPVDRSNRNEKGQFLPEYNQPRPRRDPDLGAVFESVEEKRQEKDLTRLSIRTTRVETIENKLLALMSLPVVSEKGRFDGVTEPRGEWLQSLGAHDYMPETLAKFARELKFAEVSQPLLERHAQLWYGYVSESIGPEAAAAVLYVDGTVKPHWTETFHKSGRVATVGRVMPCLETVLLHTGSGVPLYLKTYPGNAPLVKDVLPLIHQMEGAIGRGMIGRLSVLDGEMSSVALFKSFDADIDPETGQKGRYFITPLSRSRVKDLDQVQDLKHLVEYRNGDWIGEGSLELLDSKDRKADPYKVRALVLQRRGKATFTVFATNAPAGEYIKEELLDTYFGRWPAQELVFRDLNGALSFKAVHGYGKRQVTNVAVIDRITKLETQIIRGNDRLERLQLVHTTALGAQHQSEVQNRAITRRIEGAQHRQRVLSKEHRTHTAPFRKAQKDEEVARRDAELETLRLEKAKMQAELAEAKLQNEKLRIATKQAQLDTLETQREIYQTDVELDQTLSALKLGFALLVQYLLHHFFGGLAIELNTFIREILALLGTRITTPTTETIVFRGNRRNPKMMTRLEEACARINALEHQRGGRTIRFEVSWPEHRRHAT